MGAEIRKAREMEGCGVELRVSDLQMNAWTWRVYDTVKDKSYNIASGELTADLRLIIP